MLPELPETTLAERIHKARIAHRLSQHELAAKVEVTNQAVSAWETGKARPSIDLLVKLADLFQVTLDWLMGRKPTTAPEAMAS